MKSNEFVINPRFFCSSKSYYKNIEKLSEEIFHNPFISTGDFCWDWKKFNGLDEVLERSAEEKYALENKIVNTSGRQEVLEALLNQYIFEA